MSSRYTDESYELEDVLLKADVHDGGGDKHAAFTALLDLINRRSLFKLFDISLLHADDHALLLMITKVLSQHTLSRSRECLLMLLIRRLTAVLCPHTTQVHSCRSLLDWHLNYCELIQRVIIKCHPQPSWRRLLRELMVSDLNHTHLFDGSVGVVHDVQLLLNSIVDAMHQADDLVSLKDLLLQSRQYEKWFSFHQVTYPLFGDWTVLHFLSSATSSSNPSSAGGNRHHQSNMDLFKHLTSVYGCSVMSCDKLGRSPLHVAASCLNYRVALYIAEALPSTVSIHDHRGEPPLSGLLLTLSLSRWTKKISSLALESLLVALLPASQSALIWDHLHSIDEVDSHAMMVGCNTDAALDTAQLAAISRRSAYARLTNLYYSVVFTDDGISQTMIRTASSTPRSRWRGDVVEEALYGCVRRGRELTVDLLLSEFEHLFPVLDCRPSLEEQGQEEQGQEEEGEGRSSLRGDRVGSALLGVLDTCLCYALVRGVNRNMLSSLLHRYAAAVEDLCARIPLLNEVDGSKVEEEDDHHHPSSSSFLMDYSCFLYLTVMRRDLSTLNVVRSILPSSILRAFMYPPTFRFIDPISSTEASPRQRYVFSSSFQLRLLRFASTHPSEAVLSFARDLGGLSPLAMACAVGDPDMLQTLLGSCCPHAPASSSASSSYVRPNYYTTSIITRSEFQAARADFHMPILCCVYFGHSSCLHVMRSHLGSRLLYRLCFTESGEIDDDYDDDMVIMTTTMMMLMIHHHQCSFSCAMRCNDLLTHSMYTCIIFYQWQDRATRCYRCSSLGSES